MKTLQGGVTYVAINKDREIVQWIRFLVREDTFGIYLLRLQSPNP
ncbi:MAG: hypothetical protein RIM83_08205 [Allomuricauda sp.]